MGVELKGERRVERAGASAVAVVLGGVGGVDAIICDRICDGTELKSVP